MLLLFVGVQVIGDAPDRGGSGFATLPQVKDKARIADGGAPKASWRHSTALQMFFDTLQQHTKLLDSVFDFCSQVNSYLSRIFLRHKGYA